MFEVGCIHLVSKDLCIYYNSISSHGIISHKVTRIFQIVKGNQNITLSYEVMTFVIKFLLPTLQNNTFICLKSLCQNNTVISL